MSFSINTNLLTLNAQSALRSNQSLQSKTMERLSTGVRVNGAEDDAAGLAIGNRMTSQIRGLDQAVRNIHDGISLIETADGGLSSIEKILQRMRELAIQSSNGTYTESDRATLNSESILLQQAISQVVSSTQFNNQTLLDGTFYDKRIQLGANRDQQIELDIPSMSLTDIGAVNTSITQITHVTLSTPPNPSPLITQNPNYIEYTNLGTPEETLSVTKSLSPNVANDAISIVGTNVYRGNGVAAVQIGTIDGQLDGTGGKALRINLEQQFSNGSFDTGVAGSSSIQGWTAINQRVWLDGSSTLAGWPTPIDATTAPGGGIESASGSGTFTSILSADTVANSGLSVQLTSNLNGVTNNPSGVGGVLHGPALYSDSSIFLNQGDTISFEWKASGGSDAFDVYAYILDTQSGHTEKLLDSTGLSRFVTQPWTEVSHTINTSGDYKFVFVSGTWDETAGQAAGANLYIDNVRANSSTPPLMSNSDVSKLTELVIYQNSAEINASLSIDGVVVSSGPSASVADSATNLQTEIEKLISAGTIQDIDFHRVDNQFIFKSNVPGSSFSVDPTNQISSSVLEIEINDATPTFSEIDISTIEFANSAISSIDMAINVISAVRAKLGGYINTLGHAGDNVSNIAQNTTSSRSTILDANYAVESSKLAKSQIIQQAGTAVLAQANQRFQKVLDLLKAL